jgi:putative copper export protein
VIQGVLRSIGTFLDLTALTALIGSAWCLIWIVPYAKEESPSLLSVRLRRLLLVCLAALVISSISGLLLRSMEMSGLPVTAVLPLLPAVLFKSHYGSIWFVRMAGLAAAWIVVLAGRRSINSRIFSVLLLLSGAVIAFSRSASGHPADFGDLSPQQLADWLHLLAVSSWAGALLALAACLQPSLIAEDSLFQRSVAGMADRFYVLFGPVLTVLVFTGLYNTWVEVGSFQALTATPYGYLLSAKLILFFLLVLRYIAPPAHGQDEALFALRFLRRTRTEAVIVLGVLLSVSWIVQQVPARHYAHLAHAQGADHAAHMHHTAKGPEPIVSLELRPEKVTAGRPVSMTVSIKDPDGKPLKGLEVAHERILHAIIISRDLKIFAHIHSEDIGPITDEMLKTATLPLQFTFPKAGAYLVGLDFAAADNFYSKSFPINVTGSPGMGEPKIDFSSTKTFGDYRVTLSLSPKDVIAGKATKLVYSIEKDGKPVTDLEPYLGASMHLATVPTNLKLFMHAHGMTPEEPHSPLGHMHAAPPLKFGPEIDADIEFPVKGTYKVFSQVKHKGKVLLFDFMVNVQ